MIQWSFCCQIQSNELSFFAWSFFEEDISDSILFKLKTTVDSPKIPLSTRILITRYYPEDGSIYTPPRRVFIVDKEVVFSLPAPQKLGDTEISSLLAVKRSKRGYPNFSVNYFWACNIYKAVFTNTTYPPRDVLFSE